MSVYTQHQHIPIANGHITMGPPSFTLRYRDQEWFMEWHPYAGPTVLDRRTEDPRKMQPKRNSPFWLVSKLWHDQGGRVEDGEGIYEIPPVTEQRARKIGPKTYLAIWDDKEYPDAIVIKRYYKGYEDYQLLT